MDAPATPLALWVLPVADVGGVGRHALDVARAGIPGHRLAFLMPAGPIASSLQDLGVEVRTAPVDPASGVPAGVRAVREAIRALGPAVVHSHLSYADLLVALGGSGALRVSTEHGIARDDLVYHGSVVKARIKALAHTMRVRRFDRLIAVSESTREQMIAKWHVRQPITVILNGVDRPEPAPVPTPGWRFLSLSRLAPEKRLPELVEAFAVLHDDQPAARLTIAGAGPLESELRQQVIGHGLAAAVDFPGVVDPFDALATHDVVAQLSVWENASYTLLDAVVRRLGVVATPVGGNPEIVSAASLVDSLHPEAVAEALRAQACEVDRRPVLRADWPTVAQMTGQISDVYVGRRR